MVLNLDYLITELMAVPANHWQRQEPHIVTDESSPNNSTCTHYYTLNYQDYFIQLEGTLGGPSSGSITLHLFTQPNGPKQKIADKITINKEIAQRARISISPLAELYDNTHNYYLSN